MKGVGFWTSTAAPLTPTTQWAVGGQKVLKLRLLASRPRVRGASFCPRKKMKKVEMLDSHSRLEIVELDSELHYFAARASSCSAGRPRVSLPQPHFLTFETQIGHLSKLIGP